MDKKPFVSVLDLLLRPDLPDVRRELPEKRVEASKDCGRCRELREDWMRG